MFWTTWFLHQATHFRSCINFITLYTALNLTKQILHSRFPVLKAFSMRCNVRQDAFNLLYLPIWPFAVARAKVERRGSTLCRVYLPEGIVLVYFHPAAYYTARRKVEPLGRKSNLRRRDRSCHPFVPLNTRFNQHVLSFRVMKFARNLSLH